MPNLIFKFPEYSFSLQITHNKHKCYYETAEQYLNRPEGIGVGGYQPDEWISDQDFLDAIENDSIWEIQWYPSTPIGSCNAYGSTLKNALKAANKD